MSDLLILALVEIKLLMKDRCTVKPREFLEAVKECSQAAYKRESLLLVTEMLADGKLIRRIISKDAFVKELESDNEVTILRSSIIENTIRDAKEPILFLASGAAEGNQVLVEIIDLPRMLVILGAGHVGAAIARIGSLLAYDIILVDDRREFLYSEKLATVKATRLLIPFDEVSRKIDVHDNSAVIIVTRGHQSDEVCLRQFINTTASYIGMIGSKRRVLGILNRLQSSVVSEESLPRVFAPIGLKIGAVTPEEIAIAILAEVIEALGRNEKRS